MGLLDFLNSDDAQLGLGLLAAGGPSATPMSLGQRLALGVGQANESKNARMRQKYMESQIAENESQNETRRLAAALAAQQQSVLADWIASRRGGAQGGGGGGAGGPQVVAGSGAPVIGGALLGPGPSGGGGGGGGGYGANDRLTPNDLIALKVGAKLDLTDIAKLQQQDFRVNSATNLMFDNNNPNDPNRPGGSSKVYTRGPNGVVTWHDVATGQVGIENGSTAAAGTFADVANLSQARHAAGREVIKPGGRMGGQSVAQEIGIDPLPGATPPAPVGMQIGGSFIPSSAAASNGMRAAAGPPLIGPGSGVAPNVGAQQSAIAAGVPGMAGRIGPTNRGEATMQRGAAEPGMFGYGGDSAAARMVASMKADLANPAKQLTPAERQMMTEYIASTEASMRAAGGDGGAPPQATPAPLIAQMPDPNLRNYMQPRGAAPVPAAAVAPPVVAPQAGPAPIEGGGTKFSPTEENQFAAEKVRAETAARLAAEQAAAIANEPNAARQAAAKVAAEEAARNAAANANAPTAQANAVSLDQAKKDVVPTADRRSKVLQADSAIQLIDEALKHPGRETATGPSGTFDPRNYFPGTDAHDFKIRLEQLGGKAFLTAYEGMRGTGPVSEAEGLKAQSAVARLQAAQSDKAFETALKDYRASLNAMRDEAIRLGGSGALGTEKTAGSATLSSLPPANASNKDRTATGSDGSKWKSNGIQWKQVQ